MSLNLMSQKVKFITMECGWLGAAKWEIGASWVVVGGLRVLSGSRLRLECLEFVVFLSIYNILFLFSKVVITRIFTRLKKN